MPSAEPSFTGKQERAVPLWRSSPLFVFDRVFTYESNIRDYPNRSKSLTVSASIQSHDYKFALASTGGRWSWVVRLDTSKSTPSYQVRDIVSPYGLLRDSIPLPGDVVKAMAQAIVDLASNFAPTILVGPPTSFTFTVDEGRGASAVQTGLITNSGIYGSLLDAILTPSAAYVKVTPGHLGGLAINMSGTYSLYVDSTSLLASSSPISASLSVSDATATNTPQSIPVTIIVRPKATIGVSPTSLNFSVVKPLTGSFPSIATQTFAITNTGPSGSVLDFQVKKLIGPSDWLTGIVASSGTLASSASATITITVAPPDSMVAGTYTETLRISGYSSNSYLDVQIQLVIS